MTQSDHLVYELKADSDYWECLGTLGKPELQYEQYGGPDFAWTIQFFEMAKKFPDSGVAVFNCPTWLVKYIDFPCVDISWPVMSRRMYEIIAARGKFKHEVIPVVINLNDAVNNLEEYNGFHWTRPPRYLTDYVALHLLEHLEDAIDWDNSDHVWEHSQQKKELTIKSFVLNEPEGGFPPVFRLADYPEKLLISRKTREALDEAGITGVSYAWIKTKDPQHPELLTIENDVKVEFPRSFFREDDIDPQFDEYFFDEPNLRRINSRPG